MQNNSQFDIGIKKVAGTYNTYRLELSFGQLTAIRDAMKRDHADPVSDEFYAMLTYYIDRLPGPGEEESDLKARDEMSKAENEDKGEGSDEGSDVGSESSDENGDYPIPMPPGHDKGEHDFGGNPMPSSGEKKATGEGGSSAPKPPAEEAPVKRATESRMPILLHPDEYAEIGLPVPPRE